jgi:hypothetical protein
MTEGVDDGTMGTMVQEIFMGLPDMPNPGCAQGKVLVSTLKISCTNVPHCEIGKASASEQ